MKAHGTLLVVATPIGNLADLSPRAREALSSAAIIAAEDTRHTRTLLQAMGIGTPLLSLHAHNEPERVPELLERLAAGEHVALVSDAGTPLLSDPGYELVRRAVVARELTKAHETIYRGTLGELSARAAREENFARGELTLVVHGAAPEAAAVDGAELRRTMEILLKELPPGRAAATAAQLTGATRSAAYALATRAGPGRPQPPPDDEEMP